MMDYTAERMVYKLCIGKSEYIRKDRIVRAIAVKLEETLEDFRVCEYNFDEEDDSERDDFIRGKVREFQSILFVIRDKYIGDDNRTLDPRIKEHDLKVAAFLAKFLKREIKHDT